MFHFPRFNNKHKHRRDKHRRINWCLLQMGRVYGSTVEDVTTGLKVQCLGWYSLYCKLYGNYSILKRRQLSYDQFPANIKIRQLLLSTVDYLSFNANYLVSKNRIRPGILICHYIFHHKTTSHLTAIFSLGRITAASKFTFYTSILYCY